MRTILMAFLFCLTSSIANAQEIKELEKPVQCGNVQWVVNQITLAYGERPIWVGKDGNSNSYVALLVNEETRSWTLIQYDSQTACILSVGRASSGLDI
jgi:hypothetical protein